MERERIIELGGAAFKESKVSGYYIEKDKIFFIVDGVAVEFLLDDEVSEEAALEIVKGKF